MLAGLITGIIVDLPVEISWFVYDFQSREDGLDFLVYYNICLFSLIFLALTIFSLRLIRLLRQKQKNMFGSL